MGSPGNRRRREHPRWVRGLAAFCLALAEERPAAPRVRDYQEVEPVLVNIICYLA